MIPAIGTMILALVLVVSLYVVVRCVDTISMHERDEKQRSRGVQLIAVVAIVVALGAAAVSILEWRDMKRASENIGPRL